MTQLSLLPEDTPPKMKWFVVTKRPSIASILNHAWGFDTGKADKYTDMQIVRAWQYCCIANYLQRRTIEPKGYVHRRHHHIIPQMACPNRIERLTQIMKRKGLDKLHGIEIAFSRSSNDMSR